ncbi:MAG: hypothetical protein F6K47_15640 [Symploca sp. SIO2E6]|nr:hypothetical protein [Symploca sp. SIO2E6]NET57536.1 hypothetical protein [Symploca sp. SIO2E6]
MRIENWFCGTLLHFTQSTTPKAIASYCKLGSASILLANSSRRDSLR